MKPPTYSARVLAEVPNPSGPFEFRKMDSIEVGVFRTVDEQETQVGRYLRNYPNLFKTFLHFRRGGQDFALYSPTHTCTRLLKLPECVDIGGEEPRGNGFCPVEYHVPCADDRDSTDETGLYVECGFVAGCLWGDDSSWKIQYLDLSGVSKGLVKRDERFGYIELPVNVSLANAISTDPGFWQPEGQLRRIGIAVEHQFEVATGKDVTLK